MKTIFLAIAFLPFILCAQQGIRFEDQLSWQQAFEKAKAENKYIFVDAFATWCGPCKYMSANIFTQPNVGEMFNKTFINLKVQMDTSAKDNEQVKSRYADAHAIAGDFNIRVYPTYLFFSPEGKLVHRLVGSMEATDFMKKSRNATEASTQYYTLLASYNSGGRQPELLKKLAYTSEDAYEAKNVKMVSNDYLATQKDMLSADNIDFISHFTQGSNDAGFKILMQNEAKINEAKGNTNATDKITGIIEKEEVMTYFSTLHGGAPDWKWLTTSVNKKYPGRAAEPVAVGRILYYRSKKDWTNYPVAVQEYVAKYAAKATSQQLNDYAWTVFENCTNPVDLKNALAWSKLSIKDKEDPALEDTYANLLYKSGKKEEAIKWEEKALLMAGDQDKEGYKDTIDKMKKNEKTWKE